MKNRKVAGDGFIGTVIAVGRAVPATSFKAGNAVFGIADGEWVNSSGNIPTTQATEPNTNCVRVGGLGKKILLGGLRYLEEVPPYAWAAGRIPDWVAPNESVGRLAGVQVDTRVEGHGFRAGYKELSLREEE
ncbi:hypothetical protein FRB98_005475 [Tulasnella sp. 332]|nr:hypothetical protein FRB98_005475 [Tulasnella sp. 332]